MTGQKQPTHARKAADNNIWETPRSPNNKKTCKNKGVPKLSAESQQQKKTVSATKNGVPCGVPRGKANR